MINSITLDFTMQTFPLPKLYTFYIYMYSTCRFSIHSSTSSTCSTCSSTIH